MQPVKPVKNQYRGINAHLHSYWQAKGGWEEFHSAHLGFLTVSLKAKLLPEGYTARIEPSLQIHRVGDAGTGRPRSDVTIYDPDAARASQPVERGLVAAPVVASLPEIMTYEEPFLYRAIVIYNRSNEGEPVAWIELLSPSNKPGGQDVRGYQKKRQEVIQGGLVFVELDYLHESESTFEKSPEFQPLAEKPLKALDAAPYRIIVVDPRPDFFQGKFYGYPFFVDEPFPQVQIPLSGSDVLTFDFGLSYQRTIEEMLFTMEKVDYTQLPLNFDRYSDEDKARILSRSLAVLRANEQGISLEKPPEPVEALALDEALTAYNRLIGA